MNSLPPERGFLIGVIAPMTGSSGAGRKLRDAKFEPITRLTVNEAMRQWNVTLQIDVPGQIFDPPNHPLVLPFNCLNDFGPTAIAQKIPSVAAAMRLHTQLASAPVEDFPLGAWSDFDGAVDPARWESQLGLATDPQGLTECLTSILDSLSATADGNWWQRLRQRSAREVLARELQRFAADQVSAVIHHSDFQQLLAAWRGLVYLLDQTAAQPQVEVRVLDATLAALHRDLERAVEFDQTLLFKRIYDEGLNSPGAPPYSLLVGGFEFGTPDHLDCLNRISSVAAAAWVPFVSAASPALMNLQSWSELHQLPDLASVLNANQLWQSLRDSYDSRFVHLCLPRIQLDWPASMGDCPAAFLSADTPVDSTISCNPAFVVAGWLAGSQLYRGWCLPATEGDAGIVRGLMIEDQRDELGRHVLHFPVEAKIDAISNMRDMHRFIQARELSLCGLLPLVQDLDRRTVRLVTLCSVASLKAADATESPVLAQNQLAGSLEYLFPLAAVAHCIESNIIGQTYRTSHEVEQALNEVLSKMVLPLAALEQSRFPFDQAVVTVREALVRPDKWGAIVELQLGPRTVDPHQVLRLSFIVHCGC